MQVVRDSKEHKALLATPAHLEMLAKLVLPGSRVTQAGKVSLDSQVHEAPSARPATLAPRASLEHPVRKDGRDLLEQPASWEHLVLLGLEDLMEPLAHVVM